MSVWVTPLLGGLPTKGRVTVLPLREVQHVFLKVGIGVVGPCRALGWQWPPLAKVPVSTREGQQKRSTARRHLMAEVVLQLAWKAVGTTSASVYPVRPEHRHQDSSYKGSVVQGMGPASTSGSASYRLCGLSELLLVCSLNMEHHPAPPFLYSENIAGAPSMCQALF